MVLTEIALKNAKPAEKSYKMHDSDGLFVLIKPMGGKYFRYKFCFAGKEKLLALGG